MKVLHVIPSISPLRGGPSIMLRTMARGLVQAGVTVDVATTDDNGAGRLDVPLNQPIVEEGVTYRYFPRQTSFYTFSWPLTRWLAEHVKDYDLLHIHALFSYAAIPAAFLARHHRIPYIVRPLGVLNLWGMYNRHRWLKKISFSLIEKHILSDAAAIHFTSEQERLEALELGVSQRVAIIPNSAEMPVESSNLSSGRFRARYPQLTDRSVILFLSRLDVKKGLDILLPAFAEVWKKYPCAALVIAGSGEPAFVSQLQEIAARLGITAEIIWAGFLTGKEKWAALVDADIFVLPSHSENFGVAVVEAMGCGVPVVVSDQVGIQREISATRAGLVVPCASDELTKALIALIAKSDLRTEMGMNGRRLVTSQFSPKTTTERLIVLYREVRELISVVADHPAT
jgi:glycosyltransferase involved in cell wall biosynthesis